MAIRKPGSAKKTAAKNKFKKVDNFKMLQFGVVYLDECEQGKAEYKVRVLFSSETAKNQPCVKDASNNIIEEYTREEAAELVAKALLAGRGISAYLFDNDDSYGGNARIDIMGIELDDADEEEPAPKPTKASSKKRTYVDEVAEEEAEDYDEDEKLPF
jgi:hypothetical protein